MPSKKISRCQQELVHIIHKLAELSNMKLNDYIVELGCEEFENFITGMFKVQLRGIIDGQKIKKNLWIKWHPDSKMRACYRESYKREFIFYQAIVPKLLEVQNKIKNGEGLKMKFPNCILASSEYGKETIALQNLRKEGFKLRDRLCKANFDYVALVMKNLAKLHALAFVLENTNPIEFEEIARLCHEDVQYCKPGPAPKSMSSYYEASVNVVLDAAARDKLNRLTPDILTVLYKCTRPGSYSTICHGDCWNNNILYNVKVRISKWSEKK